MYVIHTNDWCICRFRKNSVDLLQFYSIMIEAKSQKQAEAINIIISTPAHCHRQQGLKCQASVSDYYTSNSA